MISHKLETLQTCKIKCLFVFTDHIFMTFNICNICEKMFNCSFMKSWSIFKIRAKQPDKFWLDLRHSCVRGWFQMLVWTLPCISHYKKLKKGKFQCVWDLCFSLCLLTFLSLCSVVLIPVNISVLCRFFLLWCELTQADRPSWRLFIKSGRRQLQKSWGSRLIGCSWDHLWFVDFSNRFRFLTLSRLHQHGGGGHLVEVTSQQEMKKAGPSNQPITVKHVQ